MSELYNPFVVFQENTQNNSKFILVFVVFRYIAPVNTRLTRFAPGDLTVKTTRIRGRALQALRTRCLTDNPLCVHCAQAGLVALAVELDHITALINGGSNDTENLQGLCQSCHVAKSRIDLGLKPVAQFDDKGRVKW